MIMYVEVTIINSIAAIEPSDLMTDKKKSCILLFLPGSSLCEESQLRLLCLLWKKLHVSEHRGPVPASVNGQEDLYYEHTLQLMKLLAYHIHMFCAWKIRFISKIIVRNIKYIFHIHLDNVSLI